MSTGTPPTDTPILFLAGEFGCEYAWYPGFCWQSSEPGQKLKFYVYPWRFGLPDSYPPLNAPPYRGQWLLLPLPIRGDKKEKIKRPTA